MKFDRSAAERFLAEPQVAVFAVAAPSGPPAAVPLWYDFFAPGGPLWIVTPDISRKAQLVRSGGRATMVIDSVSPRTRYVSVELRLIDDRPVTEAERREIASRYLPGSQLQSYLSFARDHLANEHRITFQPTRWRFADLTP